MTTPEFPPFFTAKETGTETSPQNSSSCDLSAHLFWLLSYLVVCMDRDHGHGRYASLFVLDSASC